jgi:hypothetical protein
MNERHHPLVDAAALARFFEVSTQTVLEWVRLRRVPHVRVSRKVLRFDIGRVVAALETEVVSDRREEV